MHPTRGRRTKPPRAMSFSVSFKKDEEVGEVSFRQDKTTVIQEARAFNESPINARRCRIILTKVMYLLYTGERFSRQEATDLFFGATKLFQNRDPALRQIVYLAIKELAPFSDDIIMVTASIMKDMQPNTEVVYRPNAIRALTRVVDPSMVQGLERYFKSAIVDRNPSVSCAALVSAYHIYFGAHEIVRRWGNEVLQAINMRPQLLGSTLGSFGGSFGLRLGGADDNEQSVPSMSYMTQYHAIGLLYLSRQGDRIAVTKLVQQLGGQGQSLRNPFAICMLVRYSARIADEDPNMRAPLIELLEGWLRHKSDMVNYEAARALCGMSGLPAEQLARPIAVLQMFLSSPRASLKFAAVRTLSELAQTRPAAVQTCNVDMENLIADPNRGVATYAIAALLKTGNESSVDRLIKQISGFMSEISDEFKVIVVDAIRSLAVKFPAKQAAMLSFLADVLRDEGGYEFKRAVVEAIFDMVRTAGSSKEAALAHLCEFIEDCEFTKLSVRILHLLGEEGPAMPEPHKYIRFIYNRVILENAIVRAAAVSSLARFGAGDASLTNRIRVLLRRCLEDVDDEVRDRAALSLRLLEPSELSTSLLHNETMPDLAELEAGLESYVAGEQPAEVPFDYESVHRITREEARAPKVEAVEEEPAEAARPGLDPAAAYAEQLAAVPQFASYGPVLVSSPVTPTMLTESETEYVVAAVKHVFSSHIVVQYSITNTLPEIVLENVAVVVGGAAEAGLEEEFILPVASLSSESPSGTVYVSFARSPELPYPMATLSSTLRFQSKEVDPTSGEPEPEGYQDEYQTEELDLGVADYMQPLHVDFAQEWEALSTAPSATETFALTALESLTAACSTLVELLGMQPLGTSATPTNPNVHTMLLSGSVAGIAGLDTVLARVRMMYQPADGVTMELSVRAATEDACALVLAAIA